MLEAGGAHGLSGPGAGGTAARAGGDSVWAVRGRGMAMAAREGRCNWRLAQGDFAPMEPNCLKKVSL